MELDLGSRLPFVGRREELQKLQEAYQAAFNPDNDGSHDITTTGSPSTGTSSQHFSLQRTTHDQTPAQVVMIVGKAGAGKTRFIDTYLSRLLNKRSSASNTEDSIFVLRHVFEEKETERTTMEVFEEHLLELWSDIIGENDGEDSKNRICVKPFDVKQWRQDLSQTELRTIASIIPRVRTAVQELTGNSVKNKTQNSVKSPPPSAEIRFEHANERDSHTDLLNGGSQHETKTQPSVSRIDERDVESAILPVSEDFKEIQIVDTEFAESVAFQSKVPSQTWNKQSQHQARRSYLAIRSFLRSISNQRRLILVFDNLHWADDAAMEFLTILMRGVIHLHNIVIILSSRPSDPKTHRTNAIQTLQDLIPDQVITDVRLKNLSAHNINEILSRVLRRDEADTMELANVLYNKTYGNAFYFEQLLKLLCNNKQMIFYNIATKFRWEWDLDRILAQTQLSDNVVEMVSKQLSSLPTNLQYILMTAALWPAPTFDTRILQYVVKVVVKCLERRRAGISASTEQKGIHEEEGSCRKEDITQLVDKGVLEKKSATSCGDEYRYTFTHDKIKESSLHLLKRPSYQSSHDQHQQLLDTMQLEMGRKILILQRENGTVPGLTPELLLIAVHFLNKGSNFIDDIAELDHLVRLNLDAAEVAYNKAAFFVASEYLEKARKTLYSAKWREIWVTQYDLAYKVASLYTDALFCCGKLDESSCIADEIIQNAKSIEDMIPAYIVKIKVSNQKVQAEKALRFCLDILEKLGYRPIPRRFRLYHFFRMAMKYQWGSSSMKFSKLVNMEPMKDKRLIAQARFLELMGVIGGHHGDLIWQGIGLMGYMNHCIRHGPVPGTLPYVLTFQAIYCMKSGKKKEALRYHELSAQLMRENDDPCYNARAVLFAHGMIHHLSHPYYESIEPLMNSMEVFQEHLSLDEMFHAFFTYSTLYFFCGLQLNGLIQDMRSMMELMSEFGRQYSLDGTKAHAQLLLCLQRGNVDCSKPSALSGEILKYEEFFAELSNSKSRQLLQFLYLYQMILALFMDDIELGNEMTYKLTRKFKPIAYNASKMFYMSLVKFEMARRNLKGRGSSYRKYIREGQLFLKILENQVKEGNPNVLHMVYLCHATLASAGKNLTESSLVEISLKFDKAINVAGRSGFTHNQALGNKLAGVFFFEMGEKEWASTYLTRAKLLFEQWGAHRVAQQIDDTFSAQVDLSVHNFQYEASRSSNLKARARLEETSEYIHAKARNVAS